MDGVDGRHYTGMNQVEARRLDIGELGGVRRESTGRIWLFELDSCDERVSRSYARCAAWLSGGQFHSPTNAMRRGTRQGMHVENIEIPN